MKLADLRPETLEPIRRLQYDRIIEKHEGPERWSSVLEYYDTDFRTVDGRQVLLPIPGENLASVAVLRCTVGDGGQSLTLFLKDRSFVDDPVDDIFAGRVAICDKMPEADFFIAIVYHEWYASAPVHAT
jgi:hypothetical protein